MARPNANRTLKTQAVVYVFCEGRAERNYLVELKNWVNQRIQNPHHKLRLEVKTGNTGTPESLVNEARNKRDHQRSLQDKDAYFCVFDEDAENNSVASLTQAFQEATRAGIRTIFSKPCFEIWYWFHVTDSSKPFAHCQPLKKALAEVSPIFKGYCDIPEKRKFYFSQLTDEQRKQATARSQQACDSKEGPYTEFHELVNFLLSFCTING